MKIIKSLLLLLIISLSISTASVVLAEAGDASDTLTGLDSAAKNVGAYQSQVSNQSNAKTVVLEKVGGFIGLALSFVGIIFLALMIWAGIQWMTAQGNSGQVEKAKDLMINAAIGLVIVSAAYSITIFLGQWISN
ncbi:MAG: hypothetical protein WAW11_00790 [Patescibacteria group bacterium]